MRALAVLHPFPSLVNAVVVAVLASVAGADAVAALQLGLAMLGWQFAIGAVNDWVDVARDAIVKPRKPIPARLLARETALRLGIGCAVVGTLAALPFGLATLAFGLGVLGAGLAYDLVLRRGPWGWIGYSVAFPLIPTFAWHGATGALPPRAELLLPIAALAGPTLQLANGLVDLEHDRATGLPGLAPSLGRHRALGVLVALLLVVHGAAWITLLRTGAPPWALGVTACASAAALLGAGLSAQAAPQRRELGWKVQALAIGLLAIGWLSAAIL